MKKEFFLPFSNMLRFPLFLRLLIIMLIILVIGDEKNNLTESVKMMAVFLCVYVSIAYPFVIFTDNLGIIINDNEVYEDAFFKKRRRINLNEIAGLVIIPEYEENRNIHYLIESKKGKTGYTMYWLDSVNDEMYNFKQYSFCFYNEFKKNIKYQCVYDKEAVDYLLTLNPDIKLIFLNNFRKF